MKQNSAWQSKSVILNKKLNMTSNAFPCQIVYVFKNSKNLLNQQQIFTFDVIGANKETSDRQRNSF